MNIRNLHHNWDRMDPEILRLAQMSAFRRYLTKTVIPFSAYYGELFADLDLDPRDLQSLEDLEAIPFTRKSDLLPTPENPNRSREFVIIPDEAMLARRPSTIARALLTGKKRTKRKLASEFRPLLMTSTTGRSALPTPFLYTQHDLDNLAVTGTRLMEVCESRHEHKHINVFPFAPHLAFWQTHYAGLGFNTFCLSTGGGKTMGTDGNLSLIERIKPDAIMGMPTFIYHLLQEAVSRGTEWKNLTHIVLGGEKVPQGLRRKFRALAAELGAGSVHVLATYGFTEAKAAWPECPFPHGEEPSGYHLYPDLGIVEVIDPETGKQVGEGEPGEIVFTPLDARGSVVIRYRTGDYVEHGLTYEACPHCGRKVPRLMGRISRVSDIRRMQLDKIKGTLVDFNQLEHILDDLDGLGAWQIELRKENDDPLEIDRVIVHVHRTGSMSEESLRRVISRQFLQSCELTPNAIHFHDAKEMKRKQKVGDALKEERLVDNRPKSAAPDDEAADAPEHESMETVS